MTHLRIYFSQMEHCYSHKLYSQCGIYYIYSSSFGDIYPYFFLARWQIYFRFDFGQVFIVLVIGTSSGAIFKKKIVFRIINDFQNLMDYNVTCMKISMYIFCTNSKVSSLV